MTDPIDVGAWQSACNVCGRTFPETGLRSWISVRPSVSGMIAKEVPGWADGKHICKSDLARFRRLYVEHLLEGERGELGDLDRQVIASLEAGQPISRNPEEEISERVTVGERLADKVSEFGGSWGFILLNLLLSCVAAFQAPTIMMSQRRKDAKDRLRAENDYRVNLKSELKIRLLHEKIDHQRAHQWERLAEMQQMQIDLVEDGMDGRR